MHLFFKVMFWWQCSRVLPQMEQLVLKLGDSSQAPGLSSKLLLKNIFGDSSNSQTRRLSAKLLIDMAPTTHLANQLEGWTLQNYLDGDLCEHKIPFAWLFNNSKPQGWSISYTQQLIFFMKKEVSRFDWPSTWFFDSTLGSKDTPYGVRLSPPTIYEDYKVKTAKSLTTSQTWLSGIKQQHQEKLSVWEVSNLVPQQSSWGFPSGWYVREGDRDRNKEDGDHENMKV
jgi:hypothetical protein